MFVNYFIFNREDPNCKLLNIAKHRHNKTIQRITYKLRIQSKLRAYGNKAFANVRTRQPRVVASFRAILFSNYFRGWNRY